MRAPVLALLLALSVTINAEPSSEAEATTKRFAEALARFDVVPMVEEFHSDVHEFCRSMAVHIVETTEDEQERAELLKAFNVASLDEFKKLTPKIAAVRFFEFGFSMVLKPAREASLNAKIVVVGSLIEDDYVHVLYRSEGVFEDLSMSVNVPSVVTLKRDGDTLRVASTTQLQSMKAKLKPETDAK